MKIKGVAYRTIWPVAGSKTVEIIDQTRLPHEFVTLRLTTMGEAARAIKDMLVRGAPLIGATAAYGMALSMEENASDSGLDHAFHVLVETRPTAINLRWALERVRSALSPLAPAARAARAWSLAQEIADEDAAINESIGENGKRLIDTVWAAKGKQGRVNILTHCNAGWLATVDWGTALAPIYKAHDAGVPVHVWVDETRPRNQGASLTAWELNSHGVPHTVIADNAGGHLMQHGLVDLCIVGTDRTTARGDVCNKIGTYLKALAAHDNRVPFYVALPSPTIDWRIDDGVREIPIEERSGAEVSHLMGKQADGTLATIQVTPDGSPVANPAFDVTPARLVTALITERGVCAASPEGLKSLFPGR
jgi:methylthioribose-1-phosphate isomerase